MSGRILARETTKTRNALIARIRANDVSKTMKTIMAFSFYCPPDDQISIESDLFISVCVSLCSDKKVSFQSILHNVKCSAKSSVSTVPLEKGQVHHIMWNKKKIKIHL